MGLLCRIAPDGASRDIGHSCAPAYNRLMLELDWYSVEQLPWPVDWAAVFGREAPLLMEIGFGSGQFLSGLARRRPDANILGVEISTPSLRHAARKVARGELPNVRLIHASAQAALTLLCEPGALDHVIINYPDPWPKKAHANRRLISDDFLELLASRMTVDGRLDISTDHEAYAAIINDCLARTPFFHWRRHGAYDHIPFDEVGTKYERWAREQGRQGHYFRWQRGKTSVKTVFSIPKEQAMPHVILRGPVDLAAFAERFVPRYVETDATTIKYLEAFRSTHDGKLLVETFVNEEPLKQHVCLAVRERASGDLIVELHDVGFPRPTVGIHQAIRQLTEWIIEVHPAAIVAHSNLLPEP